MSEHTESTKIDPPTPIAILGSTIQALLDKNVALYSTMNKIHDELFGEHVFSTEPTNEAAVDLPGVIALLTREVESIISTIEKTLQVAESIANQS